MSLKLESVEKLPADSERSRAVRGKRLGKGGWYPFPFEIRVRFVKKQSFFDKLEGGAVPMHSALFFDISFDPGF